MKPDIDRLRGSFELHTNGTHVVLAGAKLYIFRPDGSLIVCRADLRHPGRIAFLSGDRLLLCCKSTFHMVDLNSGEDLWTAPFWKTDFNYSVTISPDERYAYACDCRRGLNFISRLDLQTLEFDTHEMYMDSGATMDLICDGAGAPCLLKTLNVTIGGIPCHEGGVRVHDFDSIAPGNTTVWHTKWRHRGSWSVSRFLGDTDHILTSDLQCYHPATDTMESLLSGADNWQDPGQYLRGCRLTPGGRYLCLQYQTVHVVLDLQERRVAAQYACDRTGCIVGDEFWVCAGDKIARKPFPAFEAAPPRKTTFGGTIDYSKHPELW